MSLDPTATSGGGVATPAPSPLFSPFLPPAAPKVEVLADDADHSPATGRLQRSTTSLSAMSGRRKPVPKNAFSVPESGSVGVSLPKNHPFAKPASVSRSSSQSTDLTPSLEIARGDCGAATRRGPLAPQRMPSRPDLGARSSSMPSHKAATRSVDDASVALAVANGQANLLSGRVLERPLPALPSRSSVHSGHTDSTDQTVAPSTTASPTPNCHRRSDSPASSMRVVTPHDPVSRPQSPISFARALRGRDSASMSERTDLSDNEILKRQKELAKKIKQGIILEGETAEDVDFSVHKPVSPRRLEEVSKCFVRDQDGNSVSFSSFLPPLPSPFDPTPAHKKTVIFFIRSFWCGQCQDYTFASISIMSPEELEKAGIRVIIIGHGNWKNLKAYKRLFKCPFDIYVDGPRRLYSLMGMAKHSADLLSPWGHFWKGRAGYNQSTVPTQILKGAGNALLKLPAKSPGNLMQLGGEFIFSPAGCDFAHRMTNASNHMEAPDVLRIAGVAHPTTKEVQELELADEQRDELERLRLEMEKWKEDKRQELERIQQKKITRRSPAVDPCAASSPHSPLSSTFQEQSYPDSDDGDIFHGEDDAAHSGTGGTGGISGHSGHTGEGEPAAQGHIAPSAIQAEKTRGQVLEAQWDERFQQVMRLELEKAKEKKAAKSKATEKVLRSPVSDGERQGSEA